MVQWMATKIVPKTKGDELKGEVSGYASAHVGRDTEDTTHDYNFQDSE